MKGSAFSTIGFGVMTIASLLLASCSSTQFTEYRSNEVYQGQGGAVRTVHGVEIWNDGLPNRKFKVIGVIDETQRDTMNGNGLITGPLQQSMQSSSRDSNLASQAKNHAGDAIVIMQQGQTLNGYAISGNAMLNNYGSFETGSFNGAASARYNHLTKAVVIKYVDRSDKP